MTDERLKELMKIDANLKPYRDTIRELMNEPIKLDENGDIEEVQRRGIDARLRPYGIRSGDFNTDTGNLEIKPI